MLGRTDQREEASKIESSTIIHSHQDETISDEEFIGVSNDDVSSRKDDCLSDKTIHEEYAKHKSSSEILETTEHATDKKTVAPFNSDREESNDAHSDRSSGDGADKFTIPNANKTVYLDKHDNEYNADMPNDGTITGNNHKNSSADQSSSLSVDLNIFQKNGSHISNKVITHDNGKGLTRVSINREYGKNDGAECIVDDGYDQYIESRANNQQSSLIKVNISGDSEYHKKQISFSYTRTKGPHKPEENNGMKFFHSYNIPLHKENISSIVSVIRSVSMMITIMFFIWLCFCFADRYLSPIKTTPA